MTWKLISPEIHLDERGRLNVLSIENHTGWSAKRIFWIDQVERGKVRGEHAHRRTHQALICLTGELLVNLEDEKGVSQVTISPGGGALWVHPMTWCSLTFLSAGTVVLALASDAYEESEYIRERSEFSRLVQE